MSNINGYDNEYEFVQYLNGKRIKELNPLFRELIDELFPMEVEDTVIKSWRNHNKQKTDVFIKVKICIHNQRTKSLSLNANRFIEFF